MGHVRRDEIGIAQLFTERQRPPELVDGLVILEAIERQRAQQLIPSREQPATLDRLWCARRAPLHGFKPRHDTLHGAARILRA